MIERLLITSASAWYLSYALTSTHGAFGVFERLREWRGGRWHGRGNTVIGVVYDGITGQTRAVNEHPSRDGLLDCIICLIFWLALGIGYLEGLTIIESIAAAGLALWVHGYSGWRYNVQ